MDIFFIFNDTEDGLKQMPNIFWKVLKAVKIHQVAKGQAMPTNLSSTSIDTSV